MNCNHCTHNLHQTSACNMCTHSNCGCNSFTPGPVYAPFRDCDTHEPEAPILSLGSRVLWPTEFQHVLGTIRWIGRIPQLSPDWSAGVEFDEPVRNGGNGIFNGRRYFFCPNGHALFLPIADLINNDEVQGDTHIPKNECAVSCGCRHTCHNNNSYQYISRPRDATYGHFRHNCYSLCSRDDYQMNARCCEHVPIYGKISSRRSLYHEDDPYESYITHPVADKVPERKASDHNYEDAGQNFALAVDAVRTHSPSCCTEYSTVPRLKGKKTSNRLESSYSDCVLPDVRIPHRESLFIPRGPIKLISGLKEWVSCWVLGTTRRKKRKKYFIQGSKTVTSVVVAANSRSVTGERLSTVSQYADLRYKFQNCSEARNTGSPVNLQENKSAKSTDNLKKVQRKKRPAPLPPCHTGTEHSTKYEENKPTPSKENNLSGDTAEEASSPKNSGSLQVASCSKQDYKRGKIGKQENRPVLPAKTGKALATKSTYIKRHTKKRPAPLPPVPPHSASAEKHATKAGSSTYKTLNINRLDENGMHIIQQTQVQHVINEANAKNRSDKIRLDGGSRNSMVASILQTKPYGVSKNDASNANINLSRLMDSIDFFDKTSNSESENSESRRASISLSGDESEEEPLKWISSGIISYQNDDESRNSKSVVDHSKPGDVCLKISIQKTETNVMTVERMTPPQDVQENNGYNSSLSETSDDDNNVVANQSMTVTHVKSSSSEELDEQKSEDISESNTPKIKLQPKNSVKSLVQAFNMLAEKNVSGENKNNKMGKQLICLSQDKAENLPNAMKQGNPNDLPSFPTTWQYQTNKTTNFCHLNNHHLMPIAEESHTEVSEQDAHSSVEEVDVPKLEIKKKLKLKNQADMNQNVLFNALHDSDTEKPKESGATSKACSHCSEQHRTKLLTELSGQSINKRGKKKSGVSRSNSGISRTTLKNEMSGSVSTPNGHVVRASEAALSALLTGKSFNAVDLSTEDKGAKSKISQFLHHSKPVPKHDQPIMASLYIEDKSSHRGPIPFLVTPSMSLKKLKKKVEKQYKFPKELQCWVLGETFAIQDESSLASYGVTETGCPLLLYVMATESKSRSFPSRPARRLVKHPIYDDVASTSSDSETDSVGNRSSRKGSLFDSDSDHKTSEIGSQILAARNRSPKPPLSHNASYMPKITPEKSAPVSMKRPPRHPRMKREKHKLKQEKPSVSIANSKATTDKSKDYHALVQLDDVDLVTNVEPFECPVCFLDIEPGEGAVLQECLHTFCKECLASAIQFCETAVIKCPFRNDEYSCESHLLEREIKSLVTPEVFERHLQRSMALAESQALDSFHCKTPDCPGWCLFEDNVNIFLCPVCKHTNCLTCAAIHEGKNCRQYQDDVAFRCDSSEEAKKTKDYLEDMLKNGDAMKCPKCQVILMKKWGCDWLKCSMCHTEVCWVTKGPRWGPDGRGDTSGGCKCMVNGVRCHPKCNYCH